MNAETWKAFVCMVTDLYNLVTRKAEVKDLTEHDYDVIITSLHNMIHSVVNPKKD